MKEKLIFQITLSLAVFLSPFCLTRACTIFVLTNANNTYFFNNEDNSDPNTRIWFIPAGKSHFGCGYVGYEDGNAQGGVNSEGLAFDWYAGPPVDYVPSDSLISIDDSSSERMLEKCSTVEEAIEFYKTYREPSFAMATIIIADKTGASVIIGARNGELYFEKVKESRVLGVGASTFESMYNPTTPITINDGAQILKQCVDHGEYGTGTKYSNSYDLRTGDMIFFDFQNGIKSTIINLFDELEKGAHYYEIQNLEKQKEEPIKPLILSMNRLVLYDFSSAIDNKRVTSLIKNIFIDAANGVFPSKYYSESKFEEWASQKEEIQSDIKSLGELKSLYLIDQKTEGDYNIYSYAMNFENLKVLWQFKLNQFGQLHETKVLTTGRI